MINDINMHMNIICSPGVSYMSDVQHICNSNRLIQYALKMHFCEQNTDIPVFCKLFITDLSCLVCGFMPIPSTCRKIFVAMVTIFVGNSTSLVTKIYLGDRLL